MSAATAAGTLSGALALSCRARVPSNGPSRENIILIVSDAMRADVVGKVASGREVTPNVNRLAAEGVSFTDAFSAAPGTKFSMASIFSGVYPPGHRVEHRKFTLPDCMTIPKFLSGKGYFNLAVVNNPYLAPEIGPKSSTKSMGFGFNADFDYYRAMGDRRNDPAEPAGDVAGRFEAYADGREVNEAFFTGLDRRSRLFDPEAPVFAYVHLMDSHQPWLKAKPVDGITGAFHPDGARPPEKAYAEYAAVIAKLLFGDAPREKTPPEKREILKAVYLEACAYADRCVGALLQGLKDRGLYKGSTVIFTSDHGDELLEHGSVGHSQNLFNTSLAVPLVLKRKGLAPRVVRRRVSNAMLLPTVMEWFGDQLPHTNVESLGPYITDPSIGNASVFASFFGRDKVILPDGRAAMSHDGRLLYFDIESDAGEAEALPEDAEVLAALEKTRYVSERLAREAGIAATYSTYAWQNEYVDFQNALAEKAVAAGEITPLEAALAKSRGRFLPDEARTPSTASTQINEAALDPAQKERLRALGYIGSQ